MRISVNYVGSLQLPTNDQEEPPHFRFSKISGHSRLLLLSHTDLFADTQLPATQLPDTDIILRHLFARIHVDFIPKIQMRIEKSEIVETLQRIRENSVGQSLFLIRICYRYEC